MFLTNPPPMPSPPHWDDSGLTGGRQGECIYGMFGDTNSTSHSMTGLAQQILPLKGPKGITAFSSGGMSACSAVFLWCPADLGKVIGAVIHYDGGGDPGEIFCKVLGYYKLNSAYGRSIARTFLVTHAMDMTGGGAYESLKRAKLREPIQYAHNGSACMDIHPHIFDHYL